MFHDENRRFIPRWRDDRSFHWCFFSYSLRFWSSCRGFLCRKAHRRYRSPSISPRWSWKRDRKRRWRQIRQSYDSQSSGTAVSYIYNDLGWSLRQLAECTEESKCIWSKVAGFFRRGICCSGRTQHQVSPAARIETSLRRIQSSQTSADVCWRWWEVSWFQGWRHCSTPPPFSESRWMFSLAHGAERRFPWRESFYNATRHVWWSTRGTVATCHRWCMMDTGWSHAEQCCICCCYKKSTTSGDQNRKFRDRR